MERPSQAMDDEARWATARCLLHDDILKSEDRLAGLLLLLYAQWPAAISRLTVEHFEKTDGAVRLHLGAVLVELPASVAELALHALPERLRKLGIDITVSAKWQRAGAGDWATYAADVSNRTRKAPAT